MIRLAQLSVGDLIGDASMHLLAELYRNPQHEARRIVKFQCSQGCGTELEGELFFSALTACDACRDKAIAADRIQKAKAYWESICPEAYRETDRNHPDFPKAQYAATRDYKGRESLFLAGPSRKGKTRLAMWLLRRCLVDCNMHVGAMWPEILASARSSKDVLAMLSQWGRYDVLLIDDALLTGANDERVSGFLKDLLDLRIRHKRSTIITSQIVGEDYEQQLKKFSQEKTTKADVERVAALLNRIRETFRVVAFQDLTPAAGEQAF